MELIEGSRRQFSHQLLQSQARRGPSAAPLLAANSSELRNICHGGNEETHNYEALSEQPPCPQVQLPDGVSGPQDPKASAGEEGKSESSTSCQGEKVSPGDDWQFSRADETV